MTMTHPADTNYDATRDPRTGRPPLPLDVENARKADAESEPLTAEDNQGIAFDEDDVSTVGEEDDLPQELSEEDDGLAAPSSVDINSTVPRMKAPDNEVLDSGEDLVGEPIFTQETVEGERPEALAKFAEVARNEDGKPVRTGVEATDQTAPIPTDPTKKQDAATRILREGVLQQDQGAAEAVDRLPDRTAPRSPHPQGQ
jgi:hypothetical protein